MKTTDAQALYNLENLGLFAKMAMHKGWEQLPFRYINSIVSLRAGLFGYEGLPEGLTGETLEKALLLGSSLCFADEPALGGWVLCNYERSGDMDLYGNPVTVGLKSISGTKFFGDRKWEEIVPVRDNVLDIPPILSIWEYIETLVFLDKKIRQQTEIGTLPIVLAGNRKMAAQLKQTAKELGSDHPFVVGDDRILDEVKSFDIKTVQQPLDLYDLKAHYWNELLHSIGIYGDDVKKERLIKTEAQQAGDYSDTIWEEMKALRENALKELNRRSGLNARLIERVPEDEDLAVPGAREGGLPE